MSDELSASAQKVQDALRQFGVSCRVVELPGSTRTSAEAAEAVGCKVEQIAKSIVFRGKQSGKPILVVASGINRVDEKKLRNLVAEPVKKADADFVRRETGFVIGGVPPLGHVKPLDIFIDEDLLKHDEIWAAAGTPHAVFRLTPGDLEKVTSGKVVNISQ
jgi:prolyl-tRNA editing enzyme YbaK/EbsC (Cys-tRNA(Pro) deacylase)